MIWDSCMQHQNNSDFYALFSENIGFRDISAKPTNPTVTEPYFSYTQLGSHFTWITCSFFKIKYLMDCIWLNSTFITSSILVQYLIPICSSSTKSATAWETYSKMLPWKPLRNLNSCRLAYDIMSLYCLIRGTELVYRRTWLKISLLCFCLQ